jgi:small-conductance mechanosensitive channel
MLASSEVSQHLSNPAALRTERRIAWLTLGLGFLAASIVAAVTRNWGWAAGLAIGGVLAWFNFRWLRRGMDALVAVATAQATSEKPRVPIGTYFRAVFRYALLGLCVYVIFRFLRVPLASMFVGMCALGAAAIAASVYEVIRPGK